MRERARGRQALLEAAALALFVAGVVASIVGLRSGALSRSELAIEVGELRSDAMETALILEERAQGHLTAAFARTRLDSLSQTIDDSQRSLERARPQHRLEGLLERARQRAGDLNESLHELTNTSQGADSMRTSAIDDQLRQTATALHELEETLKR